MKIAFYAPLKSPDSPVPSGDRKMARQFIACLRSEGHDVRLISRLKSREANGIQHKQIIIKNRSDKIIERLVNRYLKADSWRPDAWFTYHMFYKAPDWLGPAISKALKIPYLVAEASHAPKRKEGGWSFNQKQVVLALKHADAIIGLNSNDEYCVKQVISSNCSYEFIKPFMGPDAAPSCGNKRDSHREEICRELSLSKNEVLLLAVGMMREGAKLESYKLLGRALSRLSTSKAWRLIIAGDGKCRQEIEKCFGSETLFVGALKEDQLFRYYCAADIFVWPAVQEAYGMALLEAQWLGLPAVAGNSGGVSDIINDKVTGLLTQPGNVADFSSKLITLIENTDYREQMGTAATKITRNEHSFEIAAKKVNLLVKNSLNSYRAKI